VIGEAFVARRVSLIFPAGKPARFRFDSGDRSRRDSAWRSYDLLNFETIHAGLDVHLALDDHSLTFLIAVLQLWFGKL